MDVKALRSGMQCTVSDGSLVEVQNVAADNVHVKVKYIDNMDNPEIPLGSVRDIGYEELIAEYMGTHAEGLT